MKKKNAVEFSNFQFINMTWFRKSGHIINMIMNASIFFINNVIYDSECDYLIIYEKSRFMKKIQTQTNEKRVKMFYEKMKIMNYDIMIIKTTLHERVKKILFLETIYVSQSIMTLISVPKIKKKKLFEICIQIVSKWNWRMKIFVTFAKNTNCWSSNTTRCKFFTLMPFNRKI